MSSIREYKSFVHRRLTRIYPLHILTLCVTICAILTAKQVGIRFESAQRYSIDYLPANLLLIHAWGFHDRLSFNIVSWSISAEWFLYLIFPAALWLGRVLGSRLGIGIIFCFYVCIRLAEAHWGLVPWNDRTYQFAMIRALPAFFLGILLWLLWRERLYATQCPLIIVAALGAVSLVGLAFRAPSEFLILLFSAIILAGAMSESCYKSESRRFIARLLGKASYGLYMWHHLVGMLLFAALKPTGLLLTLAVVIFATFLSIAMAIVSFKFFERPIHEWARSTE